ncbi:unnamed protein product [Cylicocyclus nassatus]|uniref:Uncharacterized protein n=1 Tax=Cylicocyclus nassatus TaxID=53992 RepID=A0AA36GS36_CYLNA|nr:unnamed protein product [Cylicocyclus nassatus]
MNDFTKEVRSELRSLLKRDNTSVKWAPHCSSAQFASELSKEDKFDVIRAIRTDNYAVKLFAKGKPPREIALRLNVTELKGSKNRLRGACENGPRRAVCVFSLQ